MTENKQMQVPVDTPHQIANVDNETKSNDNNGTLTDTQTERATNKDTKHDSNEPKNHSPKKQPSSSNNKPQQNDVAIDVQQSNLNDGKQLTQPDSRNNVTQQQQSETKENLQQLSVFNHDQTQPTNITSHNNDTQQQQQDQQPLYPYGRQPTEYQYYPEMEHIRVFQVSNDIYNTYALLKSKMIPSKKTKTGYSTLWEETFTRCDKSIFCFFIWLVVIIQIGGSLVLYLDANEISEELKTAAEKGTAVYFNGGTIDFILPNNESLLTNHETNSLNISFAEVNLFETNPKVTTKVDISVLFTIIVADVCMVLMLFKELTQLGQLQYLTHFLPEFHAQKKLIQRLFDGKLIILICVSLASLIIISLATTAIEAMEKAIAIFFLFEIPSWVFVLIRTHPEIHDDLFVLHIDLSQVIHDGDQMEDRGPASPPRPQQQYPVTVVPHNVDDNNPSLQQQQQQQDMDYKQIEYDAYEKVHHDFAFFRVFIMTVTFLLLYVGVQFAFWMPYKTVGAVLIGVAIFCVVIHCIMKRCVKEKAEQLIQAQMLSQVHEDKY